MHQFPLTAQTIPQQEEHVCENVFQCSSILQLLPRIEPTSSHLQQALSKAWLAAGCSNHLTSDQNEIGCLISDLNQATSNQRNALRPSCKRYLVLLKVRVEKTKSFKAAAVQIKALEGCMHLSVKHNANLDLSLGGQLAPASVECCCCDQSICARQTLTRRPLVFDIQARMWIMHVILSWQMVSGAWTWPAPSWDSLTRGQLPDHETHEPVGYLHLCPVE